jgi:uncharacterized protein (TIGR03086 family)
VLHEAITGGYVGLGPVPGDDGPRRDPVSGFRRRAAVLLATCATGGPGEHPVVIGDRELTASMAAVAGALEVTVHGWDISVACGRCRPVPPGLAAVLLPIATLLITPDTRAGLLADPVPVPGRACPGDQLVAFLGRQPRLPAAAGRRLTHAPRRPRLAAAWHRGDSGGPGWSTSIGRLDGGR